jgi:hypothetical protein
VSTTVTIHVTRPDGSTRELTYTPREATPDLCLAWTLATYAAVRLFAGVPSGMTGTVEDWWQATMAKVFERAGAKFEVYDVAVGQGGKLTVKVRATLPVAAEFVDLELGEED